MPSNRKLTVIFFCDIEGYSALMQSSETKALKILNHYKQVLNDLTLQHGGSIIKDYGDGSLCLFESAVEAVNCAVQIQKALKSEPKVPLRIGLHIGDIVYSEDDVYGDGINIASRLEQMCIAGGIVFSNYIYNEIKNQDNYDTVYLGAFSLKNIKEDVDIYALDLEDLNVPKPEDFKHYRARSVKKRRALIFSIFILVISISLISAFTILKSGNDYFSNRGWILLMPLENKTQKFNLSGSLDNVLKSGIQQSGYINILPDSRIRASLGRMGRSVTDSVDMKTAKEIAIREGALVIVNGYIEQIGDNYILTAQIIDPTTEVDLFITSERFENRSEILDAADKLVGNLREGLGESLISRFQNNTSLPAATTSSLEALKLLHDGQQFYNRGQYNEAVSLYNKAIELDSNFVWARIALGMYYYYHGDKPTGEEHFKNAEFNLTRVTAKEKLWFTSLMASSRGDIDKSIVSLKEYILRFPDDYDAWYNLGVMRKNRQEYDLAINAFTESLRINNNAVNSLINIATIYNALNDYENAYKFYIKAFDIVPYYRVWSNLNNEFGFLLVKMDSIESAEKNFKLMFDGDNKQNVANGHRSLALLAMYQGKINSAIDHLKESINYRTIVNHSLSIARDRMYMASAYIIQGDSAEAYQQLDEIDKISQTTYLATTWLKYWGNLCIQAGNVSKAREINRLLKSRIYPQNNIDKANHDLLSGNILLASDSIDAGIDLLKSANRLSEDNYDKGHLAFGYFKKDRKSEQAEIIYKEIINEKMMGWEGQEIYLNSYLRLAEIYESRGQVDKAIEYYNKFLNIWKDADKDILLSSQILDKVDQFDIKLR